MGYRAAGTNLAHKLKSKRSAQPPDEEDLGRRCEDCGQPIGYGWFTRRGRLRREVFGTWDGTGPK